MLINVKMSTIVGILTFMSRMNSCSAKLSIKKSYTTSGPGSILSAQLQTLARISKFYRKQVFSIYEQVKFRAQLSEYKKVL